MSQMKDSPSVTRKTAGLGDRERSLFECSVAGEVSFVAPRSQSEPAGDEEGRSRPPIVGSKSDDAPYLEKPDRDVLQENEHVSGPLFFSDEADALDLRIDDLVNDMEEAPLPTPSQFTNPDGVGVIDDHSAAEDVVLQRTAVETIELKPRKTESRIGDLGESPGRVSEQSVPRSTPRRIGSGRLVPARLTWKPGDPFASNTSSKPIRFRWEVMLTTACCTAVCGMGAIWLLRMVVS